MSRILAVLRISELVVDLVVIDIRLAFNSAHRWIIT